MLNMKGMLAKLFSAVLALGMVIQPITPVASPIIVFAEDDEGATDIVPTPTPAQTPTPSTPTPSPSITPGSGDGEQGGGETPDVDVNKNDNVGAPVQRSDDPGFRTFTFDKLVLSTNTISLVGSIAISDLSDYRLTLKLEAKQVTYDANGVSSETEFKKDFIKSDDGNSLILEFNPDDAANGYVELKDMSIVPYDRGDNLQSDYYGIAFGDGATLEGKSLYVDNRTPSVTYKNQNDQVIVTITNPLRGHTYSATLTNAEAKSVTERVEITGYLPSQTITLDTDGFEGLYTLSIKDEENEISLPNGISSILNFDHTGPEVLNIDWDDENSPVKVTLNEPVKVSEDGNSYNITLNLKYRNFDSAEYYETTIPVAGTLSTDSADALNTYVFELTSLEDNNTFGNGTVYAIESVSGVDVYNNGISIPPSVVIPTTTKMVDTKAPVFGIEDVIFTNLPDSGITNQDVTVSVSFAEGKLPDSGMVTLTYVENNDAEETVRLNENTDENGNVYYSYTFEATENVEKSINVKSISATDGINATPSEVGVDKGFEIDTVSPEVAVSFNTDGLVQSDKYYSGDPSVKFESNEALTVSFNYNNGKPESIDLVDPESDGRFEGTFTFNTPDGTTVEYGSISFEGTDAAGNDIDFTGDETISDFVVDKKKPSIENPKFTAYDDDDNLLDDGTVLDKVSSANGYAVYSFTITDEDSGVDNSNDAFSMTDLDGNSVDFEVVNESEGYQFTVKAPINVQGIIVSAKDMVGNYESYRFEKPLILETEAPVVIINNEHELEVIANSFTVDYSITDEPQDSSSGFKDVTYWLTRTDSDEKEYFSNIANGSACQNEYTVTDATGSIVITSSKKSNIEQLDGNYTLHIVAKDNATNISSEEKITLCFDTKAPVWEDSSLVYSDEISRSHTFSWTFAETDDDYDSGFASITYSLKKIESDGTETDAKLLNNNDLVDSITVEQASGEATIDGRNESNILSGVYKLYVTAKDKAGNESVSSVELKFDNTAPDKPTVDYVDSDSREPEQSHTFTYTSNDNLSDAPSNVDSIRYTLSQGEDVVEETIDFSTENPTFTIDGIENGLNGVYSLTVVAIDVLGNESVPSDALDGILFDTTVPVIAVEEDAENSLNNRQQNHSLDISVTDGPDSASSGINKVQYYLTDGNDVNPVEFTNVGFDELKSVYDVVLDENGKGTISIDSDELNGHFILHVIAVDTAKNGQNELAETPCHYIHDIYFDNTAPVISVGEVIVDELKSPELGHTVKFTATDGPADATSEISVLQYWLTDSDGTIYEFTELDPEALDENGEGSFKIQNTDLDGLYQLHIYAVDAATNGENAEAEASNHYVTDISFDNSPATVEFADKNEDIPTQTHDIEFTVTDRPDDAPSGIQSVTYWLTSTGETEPVAMQAGEEKVDGKKTVELPECPPSHKFAFTIASADPEDEFDGSYTLHVLAVDRLGHGEEGDSGTNGYYTRELKFDNTKPEFSETKLDTDTPEQTHTFSFVVSDAVGDDPDIFAGIDTISYKLVEDGTEEGVEHINSNEESAAPVSGDVVIYSRNPEAEIGEKEVIKDIYIQSVDEEGKRLDGLYDLIVTVTDVTGNSNSYTQENIEFDTTPMNVEINYTFGNTHNFYDNDGIYTNVNPTITVEVTDNFRIDANAIAFIRNGLSEPENIAFNESEEFGTSFTLEYKLGPDADEVAAYEAIHNYFTFTGTDHAGNGAVVTENYNSANITNPEAKTIVADKNADNSTFKSAYDIIVDKVNPVYTMDYDLSDDSDVSGNDYENGLREYFGSANASSFQPRVAFTDKNFDAEKFQVGYSYSDGGEGHYEDVTFGDVTEWSNIANETTSGTWVSMVHQDSLVSDNTGTRLKDGVYKFAVKGEDKAGNKLVQSHAEETKNNTPHKSVAQSNAGEFATEYKIVDTQIGVEMVIEPSSAADAYRYVKTPSGESDSESNRYWSDRNATVSVDTDSDNYREMSKNTITYNIVSSTDSANQPYNRNDAYGEFNATLSGEQRFHVSGLVVTDRAGNTITYDMGEHEIYLDVSDPNKPTIDAVSPEAKIDALAEYTARSADGRPLFAGDVTLRLTVTEPNVEFCSGLDSVTYEVRADGSLVLDETVPFNAAGVPSWTNDITVTNDTNNIEVKLTAVDKAGNAVNTPTIYTFGIDKTAPVITVTYDNNDVSHDKYFKANRTATVTIQDRNIDFSKINVETSVGHSGLSAAVANGNPNGVGNDDTRTFTIPYTEDGDYTLHISGTDAVGHQAAPATSTDVAPWEFTIDKTTPVINVSFNNNDVRNGKYYNAGRIATVTIDEHNFLANEVTIDQTASIQRGSTGAPSPSGFGTNGDTHTASINYSADGNYTLRVNYTDMAGNVAEEYVVNEFTIDTTDPVVRFDPNTVTDNMATNGVIAPSVIFDDTNFDANGINVTLTGARVDNHNHPFTRTVTQFGSVITFSDFARVKESDDIYTAKATITDLAGNTAEATVRFSVNRFGSTFDFNEDEPTIDLVDNYYAQETENVIIREVNVNKLTGYTLTVNRDGSNITLVEGEDFRVISSQIAGGYQYIYEIFPEVFSSEGTYSIIVQSVDEAGNTNTNSTVRTDDGVNDYPVVFAIDKTLPTVSIDELDPDDRSNNNFNENTKTFRISVRDNNAMSRVIVTVDGNVVFDMDGQELAEYLEEHGGFVEITLDAASGYQTIKVQAFDGAGNESADTQYQVLVTTNFFVRFFYNKPLFYGSIIFLILLLLAIAYYIKKRMDKQKKNA